MLNCFCLSKGVKYLYYTTREVDQVGRGHSASVFLPVSKDFVTKLIELPTRMPEWATYFALQSTSASTSQRSFTSSVCVCVRTHVVGGGLVAQDELQDALALRVAGHGHVERGRHAALDRLVQVLRPVGRTCAHTASYNWVIILTRNLEECVKSWYLDIRGRCPAHPRCTTNPHSAGPITTLKYSRARR